MRRLLAFGCFTLVFLSGCFGEPKQIYLSSSEASDRCMDGGGNLDLTTGECVCPRGQPWDGSVCEGTIPNAPLPSVNYAEKIDPQAIPEEHKAVYESLPRGKSTDSSSHEDRGPPMPSPKTSLATEKDAGRDSVTSHPVPMPRAAPVKVEKKSEILSRSGVSTATQTKIAAATSSATATGSETHKVKPPKAPQESHDPKTTPAASIAKTHDKETTHGTGEKKNSVGQKAAHLDEVSSKPKSAPTESSDHFQLARKTCREAQGEWLSKEQYCACPRGKVLIGKHCEDAKGTLSASGCQGAIYPGKWKGNNCLCPTGKYFSVYRGGCIPNDFKKVPVSVATQRRLCENTLNRGLWDARKSRCQCPGGFLWFGEECRSQGTLTSREVCTSEYNGGQWDAARKRCKCPQGALWLDQRCQLITAVSEISACESEINGGIWMTSSKTCRCAVGKKWVKPTKTCT